MQTSVLLCLILLRSSHPQTLQMLHPAGSEVPIVLADHTSKPLGMP
jgi:hypothetical protein